MRSSNIYSFFLILALIFPLKLTLAQESIEKLELVYLRTETNKTYQVSNNRYATMLNIGAIHYKNDYNNDSEQWKDIDLTIINNQIRTAPYILTIDDGSYTIIDKRTSNWLSISPQKVGNIDVTANDFILKPFNTGFQLIRTINSKNDAHNAEFLITQQGTSIVISAHAIDAEGKTISVDYSIDNGKLVEDISVKSLENAIYPITIDPTVELQVSASADDAYQNYSSVDITADPYLGTTHRYAGQRYQNVTIPNGATIVTAYEILYVAGDYDDPDLDMFCENEDDAAQFSTGSNNISGRTTTTATNNWTATGIGTSQWQNSPSRVSEVQEVINRAEWVSGNSIVSLLYGAGSNYLHYLHWDYSDHSYAPQFYIVYSTGGVSVPTVVSDSSSNITTTTAICSGNITATGGANCSDRFIQWGTSTGVYTDNETESGNFGISAFSLNLTGLPSGTTIYWRAGATNEAGNGYGDEKSFNTSEVPTVETGSYSLLGATTYINGCVTDNGTSPVTSKYFDYDLDSGEPYNDSDEAEDNPTQEGCFYLQISTGARGITWYYRARAENDEGWGYGDEEHFTTEPDPCSSVSLNETAETSISFDVIYGSGQDYLEVRYSMTGYPSTDNGTQGYYGTLTTANITGLNCATTYYFSFISIAEDDGYYSTSSTLKYSSNITTGCTGIYPPYDFLVTNDGAITTNIEWTKGLNSTYSMLRVSIYDYPDSATDGELLYYGSAENLSTTDFLVDKTYYASGWGFDSDNLTYSNSYTKFNIGGDDLVTTWTLILVIFSLGLLIVNFFRLNLLIVLAAVFINIALTQRTGAPLHFIYAAWFLAFAEATAGFCKLVFGKKNRKRFTG